MGVTVIQVMQSEAVAGHAGTLGGAARHVWSPGLRAVQL